jgi:hypothetical protein
MSASKLNFPAVEKGATYRHSLKWLQPDNITPVNLTNCSAKVQVRETVGSSVVLLELSTANGRITIDIPTGKISFYISDEDTTTLVGLGGVYDLEIYHPNGDVTRLTEGKWPFKDEVTRG